MPRPGPRPYECVRRAWHSDRHQPIRGSLIQEIFRVVHEIHKPATKKNKEWQEKLPIVVLKAEEIMYSKANSEAEYMDLKTLWDRTNDAINTIIRLDGTTETGVFLQPCIEAALHLGCTPRRASRSQRNMAPSYYLSPISPGPMSVTSSSLRNTTQENHRTTNQFMSSYSDSRKTSFSCLGKASQIPAVYPLHYGDLKSKESKFTFDIPPKLSSHSMELSEMGVKPIIYCKLDALNKTTQDVRNAFENSHENGCDLSLRLGCLGGPCAIIENSVIKDLEHVGSKTLQVGNKLVDSSIQIDKSFFNKSYICDAVDTCSTDWVSETEKFNLRTILRKRKAVFDHLCEDKQLSRHPKLTFHDSTERMHNAGLINVQKSDLVSFKIIENMETVASEERDEMDGDDSEDEVLKLNSIRKR